MFNFKNKTLAIAICAAFCLSACGDNVNAPQNAVINKELTQRNVQAELEYKVAKMLEENVTQKLMGNDNTLKIQQYVIDTFSANNIRMEPTLENYKWYAERELVPAWFEKVSSKDFKETYKSTLDSGFLFNQKGEVDKKAINIVKDLFFLGDGVFLLNNNSVENSKNILVAFDTLLLALFPPVYSIDSFGDNRYFPDRLNKVYVDLMPMVSIFANEIIIKKKTKIDFESVKKDYAHLFKRGR